MHARSKLSGHWIHTSPLSKTHGFNLILFEEKKKFQLVKTRVILQTALTVSNYMGHQVYHMLTIAEEPMDFLRG